MVMILKRLAVVGALGATVIGLAGKVVDEVFFDDDSVAVQAPVSGVSSNNYSIDTSVDTAAKDVPDTGLRDNFKDAGSEAISVVDKNCSNLVLTDKKEENLVKLFNCNQDTLSLYSSISRLPAEFVAAQLFEESTFDSYRGQGLSFGRAQLQKEPFLETVYAIAGRPELSNDSMELLYSSLENQRNFVIAREARFDDAELNPYLIELESKIGSDFSFSDYRSKTQRNISLFEANHDEFEQLTCKGEYDLPIDECKSTWFTNRSEIKQNRKKRRKILGAQKKLNKDLDKAVEGFWKGFVKWKRSDGEKVKNNNGDHLWYSVDSTKLDLDYERITDILGALNMRRVYSDAWTSGDVAVGSKVLREGVVNYRLGEFAKETSGASLYAKEIMNGYAQLASL